MYDVYSSFSAYDHDEMNKSLTIILAAPKMNDNITDIKVNKPPCLKYLAYNFPSNLPYLVFSFYTNFPFSLSLSYSTTDFF